MTQLPYTFDLNDYQKTQVGAVVCKGVLFSSIRGMDYEEVEITAEFLSQGPVTPKEITINENGQLKKVPGKLPAIKLLKLGNKRSIRNSLRWGGNVEGVFGVELDYDGEVISFMEGCERFKNVNLIGIIYTTPTWTSDKPRWRILIPFEQPALCNNVDALRQYRRKVAGLVAELMQMEFAPESNTLEQGFYYGADQETYLTHVKPLEFPPVQVAQFYGRYVDHLIAFDPTASPAQQADNSIPDDWKPLDLNKTISEILQGVSVHPNVVSLAGKFAQAGMEKEHAVEVITALGKEMANRSQSRKSEVEDEIRSIADWIGDGWEKSRPNQFKNFELAETDFNPISIDLSPTESPLVL